jgi:hypothetical protein
MARSLVMISPSSQVAKVYPIFFNGCVKDTDRSLAHRDIFIIAFYSQTEFNKEWVLTAPHAQHDSACEQTGRLLIQLN